MLDNMNECEGIRMYIISIHMLVMPLSKVESAEHCCMGLWMHGLWMHGVWMHGVWMHGVWIAIQ